MPKDSFLPTVLDQFYRADQVDLLHVAIANMTEMITAGDIDIFLDLAGKTAAQKKAFLQKIINGIESPELRSALQAKLAEDDIEFFRERNLSIMFTALQKEAERITIVKRERFKRYGRST
jgi:hypothetical protein